jgi:hypothetical protein
MSQRIGFELVLRHERLHKKILSDNMQFLTSLLLWPISVIALQATTLASIPNPL